MIYLVFLRNFDEMSSNQIKEKIDNLSNLYGTDFDEHFFNEMLQFQAFVKLFLAGLDKMEMLKKEGISFERWMYKLIIEKQISSSFPNVEVVLKIYLVIMSGNVSGERSFSTFKYIKNERRTSMSQAKLNNLTMLYQNSDVMRKFKFDDIIQTFATKKARKVTI